MRRAFILILLLVSLGWSFNIQEYLGPNESAKNVTYLDMVGPGGAYVMYYINNEPVMLVHNNEIVEDREIIAVVLEQYFFTKDFPKAAELQSIRKKALYFNESRSFLYKDEYIKEFFPAESYCKQITGLQVRHCNKNETNYHPCLMSCGAVQICRGSILEGGITSIDKSTRDFLDGILSLDDETMNLDLYIKNIIEITTRLENSKYSDYNEGTVKDFNMLVASMEGIQVSAEKINNNILFSDLLKAPGLQSYCGLVNYSFSTANDLAQMGQNLRSRANNLFNSEAIAKDVLNNTEYRKALKVKIRTESDFGEKLAVIDSRYGELYAKYVKVSKYIKDSTLTAEIDILKAKKDSARDDIYRGDYNKATLTIKQFNVLADAFSSKIGGYFNSTVQLENYRNMAEKKLVVAEWDLEINNILLNQQLQQVKADKAALDEKLTKKAAPEEIANITQQYSTIVSRIDEIIQVKREHALDTVLNKVVMAANSYSDTLASAYASVSDGSYQQRKQMRDLVIPATLVMFDLIAIGTFIAAFVYMVGSGRIRLRKLAAVMWSFIFIAFFMAVAGGSIGIYLLIDQKTNRASFDTFYFDLNSSDTVAIVLDKRPGDISDSCALQLKDTLEKQMNKTVYLYSYGIDGCELRNYTKGADTANMTGKITIEACEDKMQKAPRIFLVKADADSTTFSVKYYSSAAIAGSADYLQQCQLGVILAESP